MSVFATKLANGRGNFWYGLIRFKNTVGIGECLYSTENNKCT